MLALMLYSLTLVNSCETRYPVPVHGKKGCEVRIEKWGYIAAPYYDHICMGNWRAYRAKDNSGIFLVFDEYEP